MVVEVELLKHVVDTHLEAEVGEAVEHCTLLELCRLSLLHVRNLLAIRDP